MDTTFLILQSIKHKIESKFPHTQASATTNGHSYECVLQSRYLNIDIYRPRGRRTALETWGRGLQAQWEITIIDSNLRLDYIHAVSAAYDRIWPLDNPQCFTKFYRYLWRTLREFYPEVFHKPNKEVRKCQYAVKEPVV